MVEQLRTYATDVASAANPTGTAHAFELLTVLIKTTELAMRATLDQWLRDFALRQEGVRAAADAQGQVVLECDEGCIVNLVEGPAAGELCALAHLGRLPAAGGDEHAEPVYGDDWFSHKREVDGFHWCISCNFESGAFALTASAEMASLDSVSFDRWMCAVLERVRPLATVFSPGSENSASPPSQASAGNGWLAA
jgi:hypothetical protein